MILVILSIPKKTSYLDSYILASSFVEYVTFTTAVSVSVLTAKRMNTERENMS